MTITRRNLLRSATALPLVAALAAAGCTTAEITVSQDVVNDLATFAAAFEAQLPVFATIIDISPATVTLITGWVNDIVSAAKSIVAGMAQSAGLPIVQQIGADFNAIVSAIGGLALPASLSMLLAAAEALWPVIEVAIGLLASPDEEMRAAKARMTPDEARARLRQLVAANARFPAVIKTEVEPGSPFGRIVETVGLLP